MNEQSPMPYSSPVASHSFGERIIGALKLVRPIFDEVRRDPSAMGQAAVVVALTGFASGFGGTVGGFGQSITIDDRTYNGGGSVLLGIGAGLIGIMIGLVAWVLVSILYRFVALRMLNVAAPGMQWQEIARPIGFAVAPTILAIFTPIPILGPLVSFVGNIWAFAAQLVALSETFHVSKWRAFAIAVVAAIVVAVVMTGFVCVLVLLLMAIGSIG